MRVTDGMASFSEEPEGEGESTTEQARADIFGLLFQLFDRDCSGLADEADAMAALQCRVGDADRARSLLARVSSEGLLDASRLRKLIEGLEPEVDEYADGAESGAAGRHERLIRLLLAIARDFERRASARGEFALSTRAREIEHEMRLVEERRALRDLTTRHAAEREHVQREQKKEAHTFNREWKRRIGTFNAQASAAVAQMRERHDDEATELVELQRSQLLATSVQHCAARETLDAQRTLRRLQQSGQFNGQMRKAEREVKQRVKLDQQRAAEAAEGDLQKKVEIHKWQQGLELRGLIQKLDRLRNGHRTAWEEGLSKLVLSQRNVLADVQARHAREIKHTAAAMKHVLQPAVRPSQRAEPHHNLSLLSPRRVRASEECTGA